MLGNGLHVDGSQAHFKPNPDQGKNERRFWNWGSGARGWGWNIVMTRTALFHGGEGLIEDANSLRGELLFASKTVGSAHSCL